MPHDPDFVEVFGVSMVSSPNCFEVPRNVNVAPSSFRRTVDAGWRAITVRVVLALWAVLGWGVATSAPTIPKTPEELWALRPIVRPAVPEGGTASKNPIDAFIAKSCRDRGLTTTGPADPLVWLRRVTFDLTGLAPTPAEQESYLEDSSAGGRDKAIARLLGSEQHGVRYGRHWLDVLRYADFDENMPATPGIHYWRDWVIHAINQDLPFDDFVRAQITGNRAAKRKTISPEGHLSEVPPRPEDRFALGFLARGATSPGNADYQLSFSAVETISTAFMGMTIGCAKCHDHFFDPIRQADYYSMKAIFDPLVVRPMDLATPEQVFAHGRSVAEHESRLQRVVEAMRRFVAPYHTQLYEERLSALPPEAQAAIRKPEKQRSAAEQKIAEDYHPILRIDPIKMKAIMTPEVIKEYDGYLKQLAALKAPEPLPVFWTVEDDAKRASEKRYVLTTGDPARPKLSQEVQPGFPLVTRPPEFRDGRRETLADWLTAAENPLLPRVAVNRIWQWHFGSGLHGSANDFGSLGGAPIHPQLLDYLAAEFIAHRYSMKWLHTLIVTSETYQRASRVTADAAIANQRIDPDNRMYWKYPLNRLEAESIRDALLQAAGTLELHLGGKSFDMGGTNVSSNRRTAYVQRGYRSYQEVMPAYLQTFDAEDGRIVCPRRNQTVTAPQALFLMNDSLTEDVSKLFAARLAGEFPGDLTSAVRAGYRQALGRHPTSTEEVRASTYLAGDPSRLKGFSWAVLNLDEFLYLR
ncbi:MAG: DUF1553 domain-containing protein [Pedosphaera sp.]|nr:DUF1553 domain-containing protein [Pedosphaera sp.]